MYKSTNTLFRSAAAPKEETQEVGHTWFVSDERTGTIEWIQKPLARKKADPSLTVDDRRELAKTGLKDERYFIKAKVIFAAGGGIGKMHDECGKEYKKSLSYAEKVHAAFKRAE